MTNLEGHGWFERADHFHYSSLHLAMQPQELQFIYARPHIVLKAFASEAYLKALLCVEETHFEKIHDLLALFELLSLDSKKLIEKWWNKESKPILDGARRGAAKVDYKAPRTLRGALDESATAFSWIGGITAGKPISDSRFWLSPPSSGSAFLNSGLSGLRLRTPHYTSSIQRPSSLKAKTMVSRAPLSGCRYSIQRPPPSSRRLELGAEPIRRIVAPANAASFGEN
jgi:hypothetical protein